MYGIDVSHWQGKMDWTKAGAQGIGFAFFKITQGTTFLDSERDANHAGLQSLGIPFGCYHYFIPTQDEIHQADHFLNHLYSDVTWPCLDVEQSSAISISKAQYGVMVKRFLDREHIYHNDFCSEGNPREFNSEEVRELLLNAMHDDY